MAKKKIESESAPESKAPKAAPAAKASKAKPAKAASVTSSGPAGFDTDLVASAAANLLMAKLRGRDKLSNPASIKQIKSDLNRSADTVTGNALVQAGAVKGSTDPLTQPKQHVASKPGSLGVGESAKTKVPHSISKPAV